MSTPPPGKVFFVGLGPAEPGMLPGRVQRLLAEADLLIYGHEVERDWTPQLPPNVKVVFTGRRGNQMPKSAEQILDAIRNACARGQRVVRLFAGDAYFGGMAEEEVLLCRSQAIRFEVIPGTPLLFAANAYSGIPLLQRPVANSALLIYTPGLLSARGTGNSSAAIKLPETDASSSGLRHAGIRVKREKQPRGSSGSGFRVGITTTLAPVPLPPAIPPPKSIVPTAVDWLGLCRAAETLVFQHVGDHIPEVAAGLKTAGRAMTESVAAITDAGTPRQKTLTSTVERFAEDFTRAHLPDDAMLIVGDVVGLSDVLDFREHKPLQGMRVALTQGPKDLEAEKALLEESGCRVRCFELLRTEALAGLPELLGAMLDDFRIAHYLVFMDTLAATLFLESLHLADLDVRVIPEHCQIIAVGVGTALKLRSAGLRVEMIHEAGSADALLALLPEELLDRRVLMVESTTPRAQLLRDVRARGAHVLSVPVYEKVYPDDELARLATALEMSELDLVVFHSDEIVKMLERTWGVKALKLRLEGTIPAASSAGAGDYLMRLRVPLQVRQASMQKVIDQLETKGASSAHETPVQDDDDW